MHQPCQLLLLYLGTGMVEPWSLAFWSAFSIIMGQLLFDSGPLNPAVKNAVAVKLCEELLLQKKGKKILTFVLIIVADTVCCFYFLISSQALKNVSF